MTNPTTSIVTELIRVGFANSDASPVNFSALVPNNKQRDLGPRAEYYDVNASPRVWWMVNSTFTAFEQRSGTGGGGASTYAALTDKTTVDLTTINTPLATKLAQLLAAPTAWAASAGGGTPTLTSGTAVLGTSFKNTTAGTTNLSPAIDGIAQVAFGDILLCLVGGTYTYLPAGGNYLGTFASISALQTAYPAASNKGGSAIANGLPVISDGTTWLQDLTSAQVGATGGVAPNSDTVQITGNVVISVANANFATYNGKVLEFTGAYSVTIGAGGPAGFGFAGIVPASGSASLVSDGTSQLNGATTTLTRALPQRLFTVTQRNTNSDHYEVV
jgi:hypothetical protein